MESEHVKASNQNVQKAPEREPEEAKNQEVTSPPPPPNSAMEVGSDVEKKGPHPDPGLSSLEAEAVIPASPAEIYDPNRIPASVFSTKNADWSGTSNESLFSIHMGNNSFSRDYAILFGKSGELPKLEDWNGTQTNPFMMSGELPRLDERPSPVSSTGLPPVMEEESSMQSTEFPKGLEDTSPNKQDRVSIPKTNSPTSFPSPNRFSDASGSSFAFPVLGSHGSEKNDSVKVVSGRLEKGDQQPNQAQDSNETPTGTVSGPRCFFCFSCWPRFC